MPLKQTPLYQNHISLKAKIVPFGGWDMPVQYEGIIAEYHATRNATAIFDICHMGEFLIEGDAKESGLDRIVTQSLNDMAVKSCRYGMMLNEQGGVIDDLIVFRVAKEKWLLVVNAGTIEKDAAHLKNHLTDKAIFTDVSGPTGKIDIQGPEARNFLKSFVGQIEKLEYYTFDICDVLGEQAIVSRTGYTGELGYEIYFPSEKISVLWEALIEKGAVPVGLGARDLLRIEMGYPLYGHEIADDIFPIDAGLSRFIDWEKDFIGKTSLLQYKEKGVKRKLVCFVADSRRSPRAGQLLFSSDKNDIGIVTSGTFSPNFKQGVGLGFVPLDVKVGDDIYFGNAETMVPAKIVSRPIYKKGSLKS
jgi:aminomethyltransferase